MKRFALAAVLALLLSVAAHAQGGGVGGGLQSNAPSSSFSSNAYIQSVFLNSTNYSGCLNKTSNSVCIRSVYEMDFSTQANNVGISSVMFCNHPSGTITNCWGSENDVSLAGAGNVTYLVGNASAVHLRGAGSHGTVTNGISFLGYQCDMPDAAASTFSACYSFYAQPQINGTFNFGFYQGPNAAGTGLAGVNTFSDQVQIQQGFTATAGTNVSSPTLSLIGNIWNGAAGVADTYLLQNVATAGTNPATVLNLTHTGSSGAVLVQVPASTTLQWATDNTGNIGGSSTTNRPANINAGTVVNTPTVTNGTTSTQFGGGINYSVAQCESAFGATTLSGASTNTGQNCLPANSYILGIVYRITTTITTAINFTVGDAGSAARYCSTQSTLTAGTTGFCTAAGYFFNSAAAPIKITPNASPGAGAIRFEVMYLQLVAPTS